MNDPKWGIFGDPERCLSFILDNSNDSIAVLGSDGKLRFANGATLALFGYDRDFLTNTSIFPLVHPDDLPAVRAAMERTGSAETVAYRLLHKNQEWLSLESRIRWFSEAGGEGYLFITRDLSECLQREKALRMVTGRLEALVAASPAAIVGVDSEGRVKVWNPAAEKLFGWRSEEVLDKPLPTVPPEALPRFQRYLDRVFSGETLSDREVPRVRKDGKLLDVHLSAAPMRNSTGEVEILVGVMVDITRRKRAEEELRSASELLRQTFVALKDTVILMDARTGRVLEVNPAIAPMFGYDPEEVVGGTIDLLHPDREQWERFARHLLAENDGDGVFETHCVLRKKDGSLFPSEYTVTPIRDEQGAVTTYVHVVRDSTERIDGEAKVRGALQEKELLLREIHHRVKNNLLIVTSLLSLQSQAFTDPRVVAAFLQSRDRIDAMSLVHDQLYRSPAFSGIDLRDYLTSLATHICCMYNAEAAGVSYSSVIPAITIEIDQAIPCGLIVNELLTNALKHGFIEGGGGEVVLTVEEEEGKLTGLSLTHSGKPLPSDFFIDSGDYIGLRLARMLAEQLGATLEIYGNTFVVRLVS